VTLDRWAAISRYDPSSATLAVHCGNGVEALGRYPDKKPVIPADEDAELHAKRLVAQRCLYGVDKNPLATDLAKLSLWLATLARDHEFTFLDHALKIGRQPCHKAGRKHNRYRKEYGCAYVEIDHHSGLRYLLLNACLVPS
jgi:hypothetical protein